MNKERRKQLREWNSRAEELKSDLESILWDEQNYYDNIPENLQYSTRATDSEEAIECLEEAVDIIGEAIDKVEEMI
jgi:hypothetical protein